MAVGVASQQGWWSYGQDLQMKYEPVEKKVSRHRGIRKLGKDLWAGPENENYVTEKMRYEVIEV